MTVPFNDVDAATAAALDTFLKVMQKEQPGGVRLMSDTSIEPVPVFPTGAISLDYALGVGGIPRGRVTEIYGPPGGGKTTLALSAAVRCQQQGMYVGFIDAEHALSMELAHNMGIRADQFVINQPNSGEEAADMAIRMTESGAFGMVIVDSVAAMTPQAEIEADMAQQHMGLQARLISKFMRSVTTTTSNTNTALVLLNQVRQSLAAYGNPEVTAGGKAIPFYASIRIEVRTSNSKRIKKGTDFVGTTVTARVQKNKLAPPFREAEYDVLFGIGIDGTGGLLDVAEAVGVIERRGASYTEIVSGERIGVGKDNVKALIADDAELQGRLTAAVQHALEHGEDADHPDDSGEETPELDRVEPFAEHASGEEAA